MPKDMIGFEVYLHETHKSRLEEVFAYWAKITNFPIYYFDTVYFKKTKIKTVRHNIDEKYFGVLRITVKQSSTLVRKIAGWSEGISCAVN